MVNLGDSKEIKVSKAEIKRVVAQFEKVGAIPSVAFTDKRSENLSEDMRAPRFITDEGLSIRCL